MRMKSALLMILLVLFVAGLTQSSKINHPPIVEILLPGKSATFEWNSVVQYAIRVTDVEDGNTEYEEIPAKEVFLEVRYLPGHIKNNDLRVTNLIKAKDAPGLAIIKASNCFNCHAFKAQLTGPSFFDIAKKYPHNAATIDLLANKIIQGSTGVWTNTAMPANPDISVAQSKQIIQWLLNHGGKADLNVLAGTSGSFKTVTRPAGGKGTYILTATYMDQGVKDIPNSRKQGKQMLIIYSE